MYILIKFNYIKWKWNNTFLNNCLNQNVTERERKQSKGAGEVQDVLRTLQYVFAEQRRDNATKFMGFNFLRKSQLIDMVRVIEGKII